MYNTYNNNIIIIILNVHIVAMHLTILQVSVSPMIFFFFFQKKQCFWLG